MLVGVVGLLPLSEVASKITVDNRRAVERKPSASPVGQFSGDAPSSGGLGFCPSGSLGDPHRARAMESLRES